MRAARLLACAIPLTACLAGIDSETGPKRSTEKDNDFLRATVAGSAWEARGDGTTFRTDDLISFKLLASSASQSVELRLVKVGRLGTYSIGGFIPPYASVSFRSAGGVTYGNTGTGSIGSVTITELTPSRVTGTFAFDGVRVDGAIGQGLSVTGGSFSIAIIPAYSVEIFR